MTTKARLSQHGPESVMSAQNIDPRELRKAFGAFMTGVTVVTTIDQDGKPRGFTANSFTSVSLDPPLVLVCIDRETRSISAYNQANNFAISILADTQREISNIFAGKSPDKFEHVNWRHGCSGSPIIEDSIAYLDCSVHDRYEAGDHMILIGKVIEYNYIAANPLGFWRGAYLSPNLEQEAIPVPGQRSEVGAILESEGQVLLIRDSSSNALCLPKGTRLGRVDMPKTLHANLACLNVDAEIGFVFAIFENHEMDLLSVYYRGLLKARPDTSESAGLYPLMQLPYHLIKDQAEITMLKRYAKERAESRYGIYVGDFVRGEVHPLHISTI